jgi:hypothetical protein
MWGNFITKGDPRISVELAKGTSGNASAESSNAANDWPMFIGEHPVFLDANITGGTPITVSPFGGINVTELVQPGLSNDSDSQMPLIGRQAVAGDVNFCAAWQ